MFFKGGSLFLFGHGAAAIALLLIAVPSLFKHITQKQGLSISLAIFLTYIGQASFYYFSSYTLRERRLFKLFETFMILFAIYVGLQLIPFKILVYYEYLVVLSHPIISLLEGFSFMIVLLAFGQWLMDIIFKLDSEEGQETIRFTVLKVFILSSSLIIFSFSVYWLYMIIISSSITNISTALLSSSLTLFFILFLYSLLAQDTHMVITDSLFLFVYLVYNIWILSRHSLPNKNITFNAQKPFAKWIPTTSASNTTAFKTFFQDLLSIAMTPLSYFYSNAVPTLTSPISFIFDQSLKTWSVEIILNFLFRTSLFIIVPKLVDLAHYSEEEEERLSDTLNSLGKACLVLVYTYAGGFNLEKNVYYYFSNVSPTISCVCESQYWRWANIYLVLFLYMVAIINSKGCT